MQQEEMIFRKIHFGTLSDRFGILLLSFFGSCQSRKSFNQMSLEYFLLALAIFGIVSAALLTIVVSNIECIVHTKGDPVLEGMLKLLPEERGEDDTKI